MDIKIGFFIIFSLVFLSSVVSASAFGFDIDEAPNFIVRNNYTINGSAFNDTLDLYNSTMESYVDDWDTLFNNTLKAYVDDVASEPDWNANYTAFLIAYAYTTNETFVEIELDPKWTANWSILNNTLDLYNDSVTAYADDTFLTSYTETDPKWTANWTLINDTNDLYNSTLKSYIDDKDTLFNNTLKAYVDDLITEDIVEAYIFDTDNTANLGLNSYNITNISYNQFCNGANCWIMYVNASDYFIIEEA